MREKVIAEPWPCPSCARVMTGWTCPACGWEATRKVRVRSVIDANDRMVRIDGDLYKPRKIQDRPDATKLWKGHYFASRPREDQPDRKHLSRSFAQAYGAFFRKHGYCPPRTLPLMPVREADWYRLIEDVPMDRLHREEK